MTGRWPDMMTQEISGSRLPHFSIEDQNLLRNSLDFVALMHKSYSVATLRKNQTDIEGLVEIKQK